jgi:hypothetical protein
MDAEGLPGRSEAKPGAGWFLLPLAWCLWLLLWLAPSMLLAPRLDYVRPWLSHETAPLALAAAAAIFMVVLWPFWPALAAVEGHAPSWPEQKGRDGARPSMTAPGNRKPLLIRSLAELAMLLALAAPFVIVAAFIGGQTLRPWPLAAAAAVPAVLGLGLRLAVAGLGPRSARWLIAVAILVAAGPVILAYAASDSLLGQFPRVLESSPVIACVNLATDGWPASIPSWLLEVAVWPVVGAALMILGLVRLRRN